MKDVLRDKRRVFGYQEVLNNKKFLYKATIEGNQSRPFDRNIFFKTILENLSYNNRVYDILNGDAQMLEEDYLKVANE